MAKTEPDLDGIDLTKEFARLEEIKDAAWEIFQYNKDDYGEEGIMGGVYAQAYVSALQAQIALKKG